MRNSTNFGCAQQQNLAAMVANPADLVRPQPMTPADGGRRADVIKKYSIPGNTGWQPDPESKLLIEQHRSLSDDEPRL